MPELPEVETIVRILRDGDGGSLPVTGRVIHSAEIRWLRTLAQPALDEFYSRLAGQKILNISRRAKFLVFNLSHDYLLIHLRMSGDLRVEPDEAEIRTHDRLVVNFEDGLRLVFNDTRKFGRVWLVSNPDDILGNLGPEPLDPGLTGEDFYRRLQGLHRQIKPLLLDQSFLAGVGNIYSDEALHLAGIHPLTPSNLITAEKAANLLTAIREVLEEGIRRNGASIDWVYRGGDFQNHFRVYQRTGQACSTCGNLIERRQIGQRSTHFCPVCQPLPLE
jgi:formamidopyrimidine-DNA glycosylase